MRRLSKVKEKETKFNEEEIVKMYNEGKDTVEIANKFGTYNTSIRRILIRHNVKLRNISEAIAVIKDNPFLDLTKDNISYWLGYLIADGNISNDRNNINISTVKDPEHLEKYVQFLGNKVSIRKQLNKKYSIYEYSVNFSNKEVKYYLFKLGIKPRKSLNIKLNTPLNFSILRGIIDGDGYIKKDKSGTDVYISIASPYLRDQIIEFLKQNNIKSSYSTDKRGNKIYNISICTQSEVEKLFFALYSNASVFLERKYRNFGCLCEKLHKV